MFDLHHTELIHSTVVDWIKPTTLKKHNLQFFSITECVLNNILKNAVIVGSLCEGNLVFTVKMVDLDNQQRARSNWWQFLCLLSYKNTHNSNHYEEMKMLKP
jgi:hypothetical protein